MRLTTCIASLALSLLAGALSHAAIVSKTNATFGSFDGTYGYRDVVFDVADFAGDPTTIVDVDISITFAKPKVIITDPFDPNFFYDDVPRFNEIEFVLISPDNTNFTLISNVELPTDDTYKELVLDDSFATFESGAVGASYSGTIDFDESASKSVDFDKDSIPTGRYRPDDDTLNSLNVFENESAVGTWRLFIQDNLGPLQDFGVESPLEFTSFTLKITTASASHSPIPEPSSLAVFSLAAVGMGLGVLRRRRKGAMN